ncbi:T9SS type A sorting domain-containing protein [Hymenobacter aquaticus]|uniref:T9SS type A sorting domain-containing protein n=1 Tax=Hymenobacter aquaticus TaxID=1867101 RepID=A0A4Z0Q4A8_9BACT|nr:T9SS type A sorting domain-containing protein [Hymenobacter aquaticus]TGE24316.1 T9SS type A sorting domain-containing protein [Hymenobacter aquaticus]
MKKTCLFFLLIGLWINAVHAQHPLPAAREARLQNALRKAVTSVGVCGGMTTSGTATIPTYTEAMRTEDIASLNYIGAEFIGRASSWWGDTNFNDVFDPTNTAYEGSDNGHFARTYANSQRLLDGHPDRIIQGAVFEIVNENVNNMLIPNWVWKGFGLDPPTTQQKFCLRDIAFDSAFDPNAGDNDQPFQVPDVTKLQARMWLYYRACSYIATDIEALHMGQWNLIAALDSAGRNSTGALTGRAKYAYTKDLFDRIRAFAANGVAAPNGFAQYNNRLGARKGYVYLDCHSKKKMLYNGLVDLFDFYTYPLGAEEVMTMTHQDANGTLQAGSNSFYQQPVQGVQLVMNVCNSGYYGPSGRTDGNDRLLLLELDNGVSSADAPNLAPTRMYGWDEIAWFTNQPQAYRADLLRYIYRWMACNTPNVHFQMPARRSHYRFNATPANTEPQRILELWRGDYDNNDSYAAGTLYTAPNTPAQSQSNIAIESDGSIFWSSGGQIRFARWGTEPTNTSPHWIHGTIPSVTNVAGDLVFCEKGLLFYRSTSNTIDYCQYNPNNTWTHYSTSSATNGVTANVAGNLVVEGSGPIQNRVNGRTIFYRSTDNKLQYIKQNVANRVWEHVDLSQYASPVDAVDGAIACPNMGTIFYISNNRIKALRSYEWSWQAPDNQTSVVDAYSSLAVEKTDDSGAVVLYYITTMGNVYYLKYNHNYSAPRWGIFSEPYVTQQAGQAVTNSQDAWGSITVAGSSSILYAGYNSIKSVRYCSGAVNNGWQREEYSQVQNCAWGLVRQPDNSMFYIGPGNKIHYLTWEANKCTQAFPSPGAVLQEEPAMAAASSMIRQTDVYPNPVNMELTISLAQVVATDEYCQLYDALGRKVAVSKRQDDTHQWITTRHIPAGLYYLRVQGRGNVETHKVLVEH